ncbi:Putative sugar O-methyltransferase [Sulfidibacter corallicola]|uniref:Putative sugar O-methyltransferase n=1 Tax=Sulfidibacter corallicola TaxID=2818388 RepID=A0A8A4TDF3_SULCO|nr:putative sugar O-methyltransferase [Sulfidibacter corallicola]QTD47597.1 putative sugar O-methyltransferase [Sulfidibacter corallicola]
MNPNTLDLMLADMAKAPELFRPTLFWSNAMKPILADLKRHGVTQFRSHMSALDMYVPTYIKREYLLNREATDQAIQQLAASNPDLARLFLGHLNGSVEAKRDWEIFCAADSHQPPAFDQVFESAAGCPVEQHHFSGKSFGFAMLRYLKCLAFLKKHVDTKPITNVLEIGGGFGSLGEIFLRSHSKKYFYLNIDIPPTAYISSWYLETLFGPNAVATYDQTRDQGTIDIEWLRANEFRAAVICPWQLPKVKGNFQLFANSSSFQEMEPEVVANYAKHLDGLVSHYLLLKNSRHGKPSAQSETDVGVKQQTTRDHYIQYFSGFDVVALNADIFGETTEQGFESEVMVFRRKGLAP